MMLVPVGRAIALAAAVSVAASCGLGDPGGMACGDWLGLPADRRVELTSQIVGTSDQTLAKIQAVAARGAIDVGSRDALVGWVEESITKNCDVWPPRTRSVRATFDALYP